MKDITLSAEEALIEAARERARAENTTLNEQFRRWLEAYTRGAQRAARFDALMADLRGSVTVSQEPGRKPSRDEMNAR